MERPKLTKKHATFDSLPNPMQYENRLNEQQQQQQHIFIDNQNDTTTTTTKLPPIQSQQIYAHSNPYQNAESTNDQTKLKRRPPIPPKISQHFQQQQNPQYIPNTTIQYSKPMNIDNNIVNDNKNDANIDDCNADDNDNVNDLCQQIDQTQRLSKLTLSSSLHMINDSKFINQSQQQSQSTINNNNNYNNNNIVDVGINSRTNITKNYDNNAQNKLLTDKQTTTTNQLNQLNGNYQHMPHLTNSNNQSTGLINNSNNNNNNNNQSTKSSINAIQHHSRIQKKREANLDTVHVVVGNEACDLDSAVSSLLVFHIISKISDEINGKDNTRTLYIPLLNTTRESLDSKSEVLWFLQKTLNIDKTFLTCKDDIDWSEIKKNGIEVLVTLVDHNYNEEFKDIGRIVEIIDHHQVQEPNWLMENHQQIRLTLDTSVGSCTTLVAERLFYIYAEHHVSDEILLLIYGTILLDTVCLSETAKRFTRRDVYLLRKLDALLGSRKPNRDELYKQLVSAKNSSNEFNFERLMKRDLKIYKDKNGCRVGIASLFGMAAKEALGLAANVDLDQFFTQNNYEAFVIMGLIADLDQSDGISRDMVLISANEQLFDELCSAFEQDSNKLDLEIIGGPRAGSTDPEDMDFISASPFASSSVQFNKPMPQATAASLSKQDSSQVAVQGQQQAHGQLQHQHTSTGLNYKTRIWIQRNVTSSRKVVAPLVLKVLHDGSWAGANKSIAEPAITQL